MFSAWRSSAEPWDKPAHRVEESEKKQQMETSIMAEEQKAKAAKKRIRRGFAQIITDKISKKFDGVVEPAKLQAALEDVEKVIAGLDSLKKAKKKDFRALKKYSKEELEAYLATMK